MDALVGKLSDGISGIRDRIVSPGTPIDPNGQELAEDHWVVENDGNTGRRVQPRPLHWGYLEDSIGSSMWSVYAGLSKIRKTYAGLVLTTFIPRPGRNGRRESIRKAMESMTPGDHSASLSC
jgi:hypothetical protein